VFATVWHKRQTPYFLNVGMATVINGDIPQPDEPLEGAAEVVGEMDPSQAAIAAANARLVS